MADAQAPDALRLRPHGLGFPELKELIEYLEGLEEDADASFAYFRFPGGGFAHRVTPGEGPKKTSKASTATCLAYLRAKGKLTDNDWPEELRLELRNFFVDDEWTSARLPDQNAFTISFLLEAILALGGRAGLDDEHEAKLGQMIEKLNGDLVTEEGGLSIAKYPATSFLTYKAVRVLDEWGDLTEDAADKASEWNWAHLYEESMLIDAGAPDADFFELAYAVLTASRTSPLDRMTPRSRRLLRHAIEQFFSGQRDGTWPRSRPLFLYPDFGYAYCYDYELLVQLLTEGPLRPFVIPHLEQLRQAAWALEPRRVPLEPGEKPAYGWSSEHHGKASQPESWPTASVYHFCFELGRLVSDAIRRDVFDYVDATYDGPNPEAPGGPHLEGLLDSEVKYNGKEYLFKEVFDEKFIEPLVQERDQVRDGRSFAAETSVSAIVYGPPGTSKTKLAVLVAEALGWPPLLLDPSHLTRKGLDNVHAEADALFSRLRFADQIVVLLDEFDELVREREGAGEFQSRFLTTAMLPKIAALHERRRLVYIVATNHLEQFDAAISRPGRFDVIVPLMPPTAAEKYAKWPALAAARDKISSEYEGFDAVIGDLTFGEAKDLAERIERVEDDEALKDEMERAEKAAILNHPVIEPVPSTPKPGENGEAAEGKGDAAPVDTWKERLNKQASKIRGLD